MLFLRFSLVALGAFVFLGACETRPMPAAHIAAELPAIAGAPAAVVTGPLYSPFVVDLAHEHLPFRQITFKDVGMSLPPEERAHVYELVAEELRASLHDVGIRASVSHDVRWSEPAHHRSCQGEHLYVDMWQGGAPDNGTGTWGYSLWSGCEAESEFGRGDVSGRDEGVDAAHPLARHIVQRIQTAAEARCFRSRC